MIDPATLNPRERMRLHSVDLRDAGVLVTGVANGILHGAAFNIYNAANPNPS